MSSRQALSFIFVFLLATSFVLAPEINNPNLPLVQTQESTINAGGGSFTNASYVPYTGATGDVDLGSNDLTATQGIFTDILTTHLNVTDTGTTLFTARVDLFSGALRIPELVFQSSAGSTLGSIRDFLYIRGTAGVNPTLFFSNSDLTNFGTITYDTTARTYNYSSSNGHIFNADVVITTNNRNFIGNGSELFDVNYTETDSLAYNGTLLSYNGNGSQLTDVCLSNGTNCISSSSNPFDQDLNTTDNVNFNEVNGTRVKAKQYFGDPSNNGLIIFNASGGTSAYSDQLIFNGNAFPSYWRVDAPSRPLIYWNTDFQLGPGKKLNFGSVSNTNINVENSYTNDSTQIGTVTNFPGFSGVIGIMSRIGMGNANREPNDIFVDPHLRLWGGSRGQTTDNMDWMDLYYNVSGQNGYIDVGDGGLVITSNTTFQERTFMTAPNGSVYNCGPDNSGTWTCSHT